MSHFPLQLRSLPKFESLFDAFKLEAKDCDVLFASYPAETIIPPHSHDTDNVGIIAQGGVGQRMERNCTLRLEVVSGGRSGHEVL
jgi:hypothetical protein